MSESSHTPPSAPPGSDLPEFLLVHDPGECRDCAEAIEGWLPLEAGYFLGSCFVAQYEPEALAVCYGESAEARDGSARSFAPTHTATMPLPVLEAVLRPFGWRLVEDASIVVTAAEAEVVALARVWHRQKSDPMGSALDEFAAEDRLRAAIESLPA